MRNDIKNALMRDNAETPMCRKKNYACPLPSSVYWTLKQSNKMGEAGKQYALVQGKVAFMVDFFGAQLWWPESSIIFIFFVRQYMIVDRVQ